MAALTVPSLSRVVLLAFAVALLALSQLAFSVDAMAGEALRFAALGATGAAWLRERSHSRLTAEPIAG